MADVLPGPHTLQMQLEGYQELNQLLQVPEEGLDKDYSLLPLAPLLPPASPPEITPPSDSGQAPESRLPACGRFAGRLGAALAARNFFPPGRDSAWEILQLWQRNDTGAGSTAIAEARERFCRELEAHAQEKMRSREFAAMRSILERARTLPGQPCVESIQRAYDQKVREEMELPKLNLDKALAQKRYVTPENDNALMFVRALLGFRPEDAAYRSLEVEIFGLASDQAQALTRQRQHQAAAEIYAELLRSYPSPPRGSPDDLKRELETQRRKASFFADLKVQFNVPVRHDHGMPFRSCQGNLRFDGFQVEYDGPDRFRCSYDSLRITLEGDKLVLECPKAERDRIKLESAEDRPAMKMTDVWKKILELQTKNRDYMK